MCVDYTEGAQLGNQPATQVPRGRGAEQATHEEVPRAAHRWRSASQNQVRRRFTALPTTEVGGGEDAAKRGPRGLLVGRGGPPGKRRGRPGNGEQGITAGAGTLLPGVRPESGDRDSGTAAPGVPAAGLPGAGPGSHLCLSPGGWRRKRWPTRGRSVSLP